MFWKLLWAWHRVGNVEIIRETLKLSSWVTLTNKNGHKMFMTLYYHPP